MSVRAGKIGLAYHSHAVGGFSMAGWTLEQHLVRPSVRVPGAADVIARLSEFAGYTVRPSQTGRLNQLMLDLWDGLEPMATDLTGPVWALLSEMSPEQRLENGPRESSLVVQGLPYVTSANAEALMGGDTSTTRADLDRLIRLGVLRRGLIFAANGATGSSGTQSMASVNDSSVHGAHTAMSSSRSDGIVQ